MMWFQRHEEPKTITDDYEQVKLRKNLLILNFVDYFRVHIYFLIMNDGKHVNVTILYLSTNFWKIVNFEYMLVVHRGRVKE